MTYLLRFFFMLLVLTVLGCGPKYPADWPKTYPCNITVIDGSTPMEGVQVLLTKVSGHGSWAVAGKTGADGVAEITTSWAKGAQKGAPEGAFKVTLLKSLPPFTDPTPQAKLDAMSYEERYEHDQKTAAEAEKRKPLIPSELSSAETTPLKIEIGSGGAEAKFDISEYAKP